MTAMITNTNTALGGAIETLNNSLDRVAVDLAGEIADLSIKHAEIGCQLQAASRRLEALRQAQAILDGREAPATVQRARGPSGVQATTRNGKITNAGRVTDYLLRFAGNGPRTFSGIRDALDMDVAILTNTLGKLLKAGIVERPARGLYRLPAPSIADMAARRPLRSQDAA